MEKFRSCPICMEVPEQKTFQCSAGHVICHSCISKVNGELCPQCRVPFGAPQIRNRVLEEILDSQYFECQFEDNGCTHLWKQEELTDHAYSCSHNPDTVPLCQQMGLEDCGFRLGCKSKAEVLMHFSSVHKLMIQTHPDLSITNPGHTFLTALSQKRKLDASIMTVGIGAVISPDTTDSSPLFLINVRMNHLIRCWSFECIKIWDSGSHLTAKYNANFTFIKSSSAQAHSSTSTLRINKNHPFPFGGTMSVCGIKEAYNHFEASPINIPILLLEQNGFGSSNSASLQIKISQVFV